MTLLKLNSWSPHPKCALSAHFYISVQFSCQVHPFSCSSQKPWSQLWFLPLAHSISNLSGKPVDPTFNIYLEWSRYHLLLEFQQSLTGLLPSIFLNGLEGCFQNASQVVLLLFKTQQQFPVSLKKSPGPHTGLQDHMESGLLAARTSSLTSFSLIVSAWSLCCSLNLTSTSLPQGIYTGSFLSLESSFSWYHMAIPFPPANLSLNVTINDTCHGYLFSITNWALPYLGLHFLFS